MELKTWLTVVRVMNCICAAMLVGFQVWFIVDLCQQHRTICELARSTIIRIRQQRPKLKRDTPTEMISNSSS